MKLRLKLVIIAAIILIVLLFMGRSEGLVDKQKFEKVIDDYDISIVDKTKLERIGDKYNTIDDIDSKGTAEDKRYLNSFIQEKGGYATNALVKSIKK